MRIGFLINHRQVLAALFCLFLFSCSRTSDEIPIIPPPTNPLTRDYIGYGVVNTSFLHIVSEPRLNSDSLGFLRRGSLVKIIERRVLFSRGTAETWVMIEIQHPGPPERIIQGWLLEETINVFNNESQAVTAADAMSP